jgi:hypothetical protein
MPHCFERTSQIDAFTEALEDAYVVGSEADKDELYPILRALKSK